MLTLSWRSTAVLIGHFRVAVNLIMKARLNAKLFIWTLVLFASEWKLIYNENFALSLSFIMRFTATRKWPMKHCTCTCQSQIIKGDWHEHVKDLVCFVHRNLLSLETSEERLLLWCEKTLNSWWSKKTSSQKRAPKFSKKSWSTRSNFASKYELTTSASCIGGLHCRHVGWQNKRKFAHAVCIKMAVNSQRRKILLFLSTNMAAMTSHANRHLLLLLLLLLGFFFVIIT